MFPTVGTTADQLKPWLSSDWHTIDCLENLAPITRAYAQNHSQKGARFSLNPTFY